MALLKRHAMTVVCCLIRQIMQLSKLLIQTPDESATSWHGHQQNPRWGFQAGHGLHHCFRCL